MPELWTRVSDQVQAQPTPSQKPHPINISSRPANVQSDVAAFCPTQLLKPLCQRGKQALCGRIVFFPSHEDADPPHASLLCARLKWPRGCCSAEKRNELSSPQGFPLPAEDYNLPLESGVVHHNTDLAPTESPPGLTREEVTPSLHRPRSRQSTPRE